MNIKDYMITIPNFPIEGVMFRDITSLLRDADCLQACIDSLYDLVKDVDFDVIVGPESKGFIFGMPLAYKMHKPFVLIRKQGKLPRETIETSYALEYGTETVEMHKEDIKPGQKVIIIDDLLATGGTITACISLVEQLGGKVAKIITLIELEGLQGRKEFEGYDYATVIGYEGK